MTPEDRPRALYRYQEEAIDQLLQRGETISLTYVVIEKQDEQAEVKTGAA